MMPSSYRSAVAGRPIYRTLKFRARVDLTHFIGKLHTQAHTLETLLGAKVVRTNPIYLRS
jgi:hypothetical protein